LPKGEEGRFLVSLYLPCLIAKKTLLFGAVESRKRGTHTKSILVALQKGTT